MLPAGHPAADAMADVQSCGETTPCKMCEITRAVKVLQQQEKVAQHLSMGPLVFLDMSSVLKRNLLINTSHEKLEACRFTCCKKEKEDLRPQYSTVFAECVQQDARIDRSYHLLPGGAANWQQFCQQCTHMMVMRQQLFQLEILTIEMQQWDEEAIKKKEEELRISRSVSQHYEMFQFEQLSNSTQSSYNMKLPPSLTTWPDNLVFKGQDALNVYTYIAATYHNNRAAADAAYQRYLNHCTKLDGLEAYKVLKQSGNACRWDQFCNSYLCVAALRHHLCIKHQYDPFVQETAVDQPAPAVRKHCFRLQLTSPTHPSKMMPATCDSTAVTHPSHNSALIYTKTSNSNGCLCIERDKIVWRPGRTNSNLSGEGATHEVLRITSSSPSITCTTIQPSDLFEFHICGVTPGCFHRIHTDGSFILTYMQECNEVIKKDKETALSELHTLQQALHEMLQSNDMEQLNNLAMIGVAGAASKYRQFCTCCMKCIIFQSVSNQTPIVIGTVCHQVAEKSLVHMKQQLEVHRQLAHLFEDSNIYGELAVKIATAVEHQLTAIACMTAAKSQFLEMSGIEADVDV